MFVVVVVLLLLAACSHRTWNTHCCAGSVLWLRARRHRPAGNMRSNADDSVWRYVHKHAEEKCDSHAFSVSRKYGALIARLEKAVVGGWVWRRWLSVDDDLYTTEMPTRRCYGVVCSQQM